MRTAINAIRTFVYFGYNYSNPNQMCEEIWGSGPGSLGQHLYSKLVGYDFNMSKFFCELSLDNQDKFAEWIMENYHGVDGWNKNAMEHDVYPSGIIRLTSGEKTVLDKIAAKSKMDCWFKSRNRKDGVWEAAEDDINDLVDGATMYDIQNLSNEDFFVLMNLLTKCGKMKRETNEI